MSNFSLNFRLQILFTFLCCNKHIIWCDRNGFEPDDNYLPPDHEDDRYLFLKDIKELATRRILGGNIAPSKAYPFVVALLKPDKTIYCSGSIISPTFVVTAAHCDEMTSIYKAIDNNLSKVGTLYKIREIIRHPRYGYETRDTPKGPTVSKILNDIALVVSFDSMIKGWVKPINLGKVDLSSIRTKLASAIGYGKIGDGKSGSLASLQYTHVEIAECYEPQWSISICGNTPSHTTSPSAICSGDSGGPLVFEGTLVGVGSLGPASCSSREYLKDIVSVFTLVSPYRDWIKGEMGKRVIQTLGQGREVSAPDSEIDVTGNSYVPDAAVEKTIHQEIYYVGTAESFKNNMSDLIRNMFIVMLIVKYF